MKAPVSLLPLALALAQAPSGSSGGDGSPPELTLYAAASLRDALAELLAQELDGPELRISYGASGDLARQIEAGRGADLFFSAGELEMDRLEAAGRLEPGTRRAVLANQLVVVEPAERPTLFSAPFSAAQLVDGRLEGLSLAQPDFVPAGRYARDWLERQGLWSALAERIVPAADVRAALAAVESGALRAGIVYRTDAARSARVRVVHRVPIAECASITYSLALLAERPQPAAARDLWSRLQGPEALALYQRHGFLPLGPPAGAPRPSSPQPARPGAGTLEVLWVTLRVALGATALMSLPALALGWLLARRRFPGRSLLETLVALPLVLPPTAIGYLLLELFAHEGPLGPGTLGFDPGILFSARGAILASAVVALPLATRTARTAFEGVDPRLVTMARSLGLSPLQAFLRVTLPLGRRGLLAALLLGFSRALGEFGATVIVAGNIPGRTQTLALAIFTDIQLGDTRGALLLVAICVGVAFTTVFGVERLLARGSGPAGRGPGGAER